MTASLKKLASLMDSRDLSGVILDFSEAKQKSNQMIDLDQVVNFDCAHGCTICAGQCQCCNSIGGNCNCSAC